MIPKLVAFDLDGTLARSKQAIEPAMADALSRLLRVAKVAVTSGGGFAQLESQVGSRLPAEANLANLYILPTSGAALYEHCGGWQAVYEELLSEDELSRISAAIAEAAPAIVDFGAPSHGERTERRGSQVTFSALGQEAPIAEKEAWDPTGEKRRALREAVAALLPGFDVKIGGSTSIDVTRAGVNKAFGLRRLSEHTGVSIDEMLYMGDALGEGGNDEVVKETGVATRAVVDPEDTRRAIYDILATAPTE
jgi:phosphomannomutase